MADKSSSRKQSASDSRSGRGRSPPSSSRQNKERAAKLKHRTPTPHPAKRSSAQLFGPAPPPPPPPPVASASPEPRPRTTVGRTNQSLADPTVPDEDFLWASQNSPGSPAVSPLASSPVPSPASASVPVSVPAPPPVLVQATSGMPVVSQPVVPPLPVTYGVSSVPGVTAGTDGAALRVPPAFPSASVLPRPMMPPLMSPWVQAAPWHPFSWPSQYSTMPGFQPPPPGFAPPWSTSSMYTCPPPGFDGSASRRRTVPSSPPDPRSSVSAPGRRASPASDVSSTDLSPRDQGRSKYPVLLKPLASDLPGLRKVHLSKPMASGMPDVYSVHASALGKDTGMSESDDEVETLTPPSWPTARFLT